MEYFPLSVALQKRRVVVVGGGRVAARKLRLIVKSGASVSVIATEAVHAIQQLADQQIIDWQARAYRDGDLHGAWLAIAATGSKDIDREIAAEADRLGVLVNVGGNPSRSSFALPAIIQQGDLNLAISSNGTAPAVARRMKHWLSSMIPAGMDSVTRFVAERRRQVKDAFDDPRMRRDFWRRFLHGPAWEALLAGNEAEARRLYDNALNADEDSRFAGAVYLVGAGPGDPDLLTLKALRIIQHADVIVHDRLVSPQILSLCPPQAERLYVGKQKSNHSVQQPRINELLATLAREGKQVCRLKGGDPFIFGRGGEEIEQLAAEGIEFQVVPGITAATGCSAYAGIPLTHRDHAHSVVFTSGHRARTPMDWASLIVEGQTLVFYMSLDTLDTICQQLINHGMAATTPAALIEQGTTRNQRVLRADLQNLPAMVKQANVHAPTTLIVGGVVGLNKQLGWYKEQPHGDQSIFSSGSEEEASHGKRIRG